MNEIVLIIAVSCGVLGVLLFAGVLCCIRRRKRRPPGDAYEGADHVRGGRVAAPHAPEESTTTPRNTMPLELEHAFRERLAIGSVAEVMARNKPTVQSPVCTRTVQSPGSCGVAITPVVAPTLPSSSPPPRARSRGMPLQLFPPLDDEVNTEEPLPIITPQGGRPL